MNLGQFMLILLLVLPALGAVVVLIVPARWVKAKAWAIAGALLAASGLLLGGRQDSGAGLWHSVDLPWIRALDVRFHVGVDGMSWPLVALTALLTACCVVYLSRSASDIRSFRIQCALVFAATCAMVGVFLSADAILFVVFFELTLLPFFALIAFFGDGNRRAAARLFLLYTIAGSVLLLAGVVLLIVTSGTSDISQLTALKGNGLSDGLQLGVFLLLALAFAVKSPLWPFHSWLPEAHTAAPTVGSVLLAGVLLKLGTYGLIRFNAGMLPDAFERTSAMVGGLAVAAIIVGSLICLAQKELKRLIAYSSIGHMGFVLLGIASLTTTGLVAAQVGMIAHGVITGLLFFLVGSMKERYGALDLDRLGGLRGSNPRLAAVLGFAAVASFGLPGLAGFWGEAFAIFGAADVGGVWWIFAVGAGIGALLTVAYFLRMLRIVVSREAPIDYVGNPQRLTVSEWAVVGVLSAVILGIGLWPGAVADLVDSPVQLIVNGGQS